MNQEMNVEALIERVSPDSTDVFTNEFWSSLDFVVNALDNVNVNFFLFFFLSFQNGKKEYIFKKRQGYMLIVVVYFFKNHFSNQEL